MVKRGSENRCLNCLKGCACILVVLNHFHHNGIVGNIEYIISHLGVPLFFLISGYYLYNDDISVSEKKLLSRIKRTAVLILIYSAIYIFYSMIISILKYGNLEYFFETFSEIINLKYVLEVVFLSKSIYGQGQWFLLALLEAYIILFVFHKLSVIKWVYKRIIYISSVTLIFHTLFRILLVKFGITSIIGVDLLESYSVRNVWFDALPFILIGCYIKMNVGMVKKINNDILIKLWISFMILSIVEGIFITTLDSRINCVLYIGTIISLVSIFCFAIKNADLSFCKPLEYIGKNLSMIVYFIHIAVGAVINNFIEIIGFSENLFYTLGYPFIIILMTILISFFLYKIKQKIFNRS